MQMPRPVVAIAAAALVLALVSALPQGDGGSGWAGPRPGQLVSYHVTIPNTSAGWSAQAVAVPMVPARGFILTGMFASIRQGTGDPTQIRVWENGTLKVETGRQLIDPLTVSFGSGIPFAPGTAIALDSANARVSSQGVPGFTVTLVGYVP